MRKFSALHLRQLCDACGQLFVGRDGIGHLVVVELLVGDEIEVAGAGEAEDDGLFLARFLALERLVDGGADGVAGLGAGRMPSVRAKYSAASKTLVCSTLRASISPSWYSCERMGLMPW